MHRHPAAHRADEEAGVSAPEVLRVAVSFSAAVGVVAGLFPAFKTARLNPIQAPGCG